MSIIDALGKGFQTIGRHWWLILIPILLDVFLWMGPQASIAPIVDQAVDTFDQYLNTSQEAGTDEWLETVREMSDQAAQRYNLFSVLRVRMLGMPSLMAWGGTEFTLPSTYEVIWIYFLQLFSISDLQTLVPRASFASSLVWKTNGLTTFLPTVVLLSIVGVAVGAIYLTLVARNLEEDETPRPFWTHFLVFSGRFLLFLILRLVVLLALGVPLFLIAGLVGLISLDLAMLVGLIATGTLTWISFYGIFFVGSLLIDHAPILRAIWNSFNVVARNFWPTMWLFVLINLIGGGLSLLWQMLGENSLLALIGIVGNAYIGTSLIAGSLIFYRDRYLRWRETLTKLLADNGSRMA